MEIDQIHYKDWRIEILHGGLGWKALVYRPSSLLHEIEVPDGPDRHCVIAGARALIDQLLVT